MDDTENVVCEHYPFYDKPCADCRGIFCPYCGFYSRYDDWFGFANECHICLRRICCSGGYTITNKDICKGCIKDMICCLYCKKYFRMSSQDNEDIDLCLYYAGYYWDSSQGNGSRCWKCQNVGRSWFDLLPKDIINEIRKFD